MPDFFSVHHNLSFTPDVVSNYFLTVIVGNGQSGSTTFRNASGAVISPDVVAEPLGLGSALLGEQLPVVSVVMEINPLDDDMVVSYYILEKPLSQAEIVAQNIPATDQVSFAAQSGQTITFFTSIKFS